MTAPRRLRAAGGSLRRFVAPKAAAVRSVAGLPAGHPAVVRGVTLFPSTVVSPEEAPRLLVSGVNSSKIGGRIQKGPWRGLRVFTLTLEERATCPRSCAVWRECFGNGMPFARRHRAGADLEYLLSAEIAMLSDEYPAGIAIRLHVLGDFYSARYAARWAVLLRRYPRLHLFGFTAHPDGSPIAQIIERMNGRWPERCAIRFSRAAPSGQAMEATTIWRQPEAARVPEGIVCPAQTGGTDCCATCGLCWAPAAAARPIVFIGHGRLGTKPRSDGHRLPVEVRGRGGLLSAATASARNERVSP